MSDTTTMTPETETTAKRAPRRMNAKTVKRRASKIAAGTEMRKVRKQKGKLAISILERIANGEIKNAKAVAAAFVAGAEAEATVAEAEETDASES